MDRYKPAAGLVVAGGVTAYIGLTGSFGIPVAALVHHTRAVNDSKGYA